MSFRRTNAGDKQNVRGGSYVTSKRPDSEQDLRSPLPFISDLEKEFEGEGEGGELNRPSGRKRAGMTEGGSGEREEREREKRLLSSYDEFSLQEGGGVCVTGIKQSALRVQRNAQSQEIESILDQRHL